MSKSIIFLVKSFLGNFYRHLAIFSGHTGPNAYSQLIATSANAAM